MFTPQLNPDIDLVLVQKHLSAFIDKETANGAKEGLACEIATSLLTESVAVKEDCFKNLPMLKQAVLDYVLEQGEVQSDEEEEDRSDDDAGWFDLKAYSTSESYDQRQPLDEAPGDFLDLGDAIKEADSQAYAGYHQVNVVAYGEHEKHESGEGVYSRFDRNDTPTTSGQS